MELSLTLVHGADGGEILKVEPDAVFDQTRDGGIISWVNNMISSLYAFISLRFAPQLDT